MSDRYSDSVRNAFSEAKAWRAATFVLAVTTGLLTVTHIYARMHAPAYLVPYNLATMSKRVEVAPGHYSPDYIQAMGFQDAALLLTWSAETVTDQYDRFLRRMSPDLHAAQSTKLMADAADNARANYSQVFYYGKNVSTGDLKIAIPGTLVRWQNGKEVLRQKMVYTLSYREGGDVLQLDEISFK